MRSFALSCISAACLPLELCAVSAKSGMLEGTRANLRPSSISMPGEVNQSLIVCNAYAHKEPLDVFRARSMKKANMEGPISYKNCQGLVVSLAEGDRLDFKAGDLDVGTFFVKGLPTRKSTLLLVPRRRSSDTMAVTFQSHAFLELDATQVAVVDAYSGAGADVVKIMDAPQEKKASYGKKSAQSLVQMRLETLRYNSIVALGPGRYNVGLGPASMVALSETEQQKGIGFFQAMIVGSRQKYVVMRVGVQDDTSTSALYPEELVVFPKSQGALVRPGVFAAFIASAVLMAMHFSL